MKNETVCKNWFMRKSGKKWVFGCLLFSALALPTALSVSADELSAVSETPVNTEVTRGDLGQSLPEEVASAEASQAQVASQAPEKEASSQANPSANQEAVSSDKKEAAPNQSIENSESQVESDFLREKWKRLLKQKTRSLKAVKQSRLLKRAKIAL